MSLRYPFKYKHKPTKEEIRQNESFLLLEDQADKLINDANTLAELGKWSNDYSIYF